MTSAEQKNLACELSALCVFRDVLKKPPMAALLALLSSGENEEEQMKLFGEFVYSLSEYNYCFSDFLCRAVFSDENRYIILSAQKADIPEALSKNATAELKIFSKLTRISPIGLCAPYRTEGYIPQFENNYTDFEKAYGERVENINRYGYGVFAHGKMFRVSGDEIVPVSSADDVSIEQFVGYEQEREKVFQNTEALICGKPAANILLYGDAGTGKSSTVKACANHFFDRGVRLIELRKDQLFELSHVMGKISGNPLKFIIFIDDLSFNKNDDQFSMLKAALEGSASGKAKNAVIYATSNRRHIVKESFSDRGADDIHANDTVGELLSLSDRFGLTVYFQKPNKLLYLDIVHKLAEKKGIKADPSKLDIDAEAFALAKGSRSPRAAEQFVNSLV